MKKIFSFILAAIMLTGLCVFPVSAEGPLFQDEFYDYASWKLEPPYDDVLYYRELAYHYDENGNLKWVLVQGDTWYSEATICYEVVGNRVFRDCEYHVPFDLSYGVYLVKEQRFMDITYTRTRYQYYGEYSGLYTELLKDLEQFNLGDRIGDMDGNGKLEIGDATEMQRCLAEFKDYPKNDPVGAAGYYTKGSETVQYLSDINKDGKRDISDVTAIQRELAEQ